MQRLKETECIIFLMPMVLVVIISRYFTVIVRALWQCHIVIYHIPQNVTINNNSYNINWHASFGEVVTVGQRVIVFSLKPDQHLRICAFVGGEGRDTPAGPISVSGIINFKELLTPGVIRLPPVTYFVGNVFANTKSEALDLLINYSDKGNPTVLYPNGDGELIIPEQCRIFDGSDKISIPMEDVPLGTKKSKRVLYTVECNS
ncbi:hypothetical protein FIC03_26270, partial [Escherichia coli]